VEWRKNRVKTHCSEELVAEKRKKKRRAVGETERGLHEDSFNSPKIKGFLRGIGRIRIENRGVLEIRGRQRKTRDLFLPLRRRQWMGGKRGLRRLLTVI